MKPAGGGGGLAVAFGAEGLVFVVNDPGGLAGGDLRAERGGAVRRQHPVRGVGRAPVYGAERTRRQQMQVGPGAGKFDQTGRESKRHGNNPVN